MFTRAISGSKLMMPVPVTCILLVGFCVEINPFGEQPAIKAAMTSNIEVILSNRFFINILL
jgi:hypothetical protein